MEDYDLNKVTPVNKLKFDRDVTFAYASKRTASKWKNTQTSWSKFIKRLEQTTRTQETYKEYLALSKAEQSDIKDVGGFVGGGLKKGLRRAGFVQNRSMLTLDIDYPDDEILSNIMMDLGTAYALYTTHKSSDESPRYRLIIPLERAVNVTEYAAVSMKVAEELGIDCFDDTTYQPHRLMFWPSTAKDAPYEFIYEDAPWLDPDEYLAKYKNWQDPLEWPVSSRKQVQAEKLAKKQGNPLEKTGLIGAFCRAYDIKEAIQTFLPDVYEVFDDNRFTFTQGSTAGGLVLYEDGNFAYSHHGTDPISSKLVNSFDLVRIHLYGDLDENESPSTPTNKLPSFKEMEELALNDKNVKLEQLKSRAEDAQSEFDVIEEETDTHWMQEHIDEFTFNAQGLECTVPNIAGLLRYDPHLKNKIGLNEFTKRYAVKGKTLWHKENKVENWTDADDAGLRLYLERVWKLYNRGKTEDAMRAVSLENKFHPIREYLDSLEWDGVERLDTLFHVFSGSEDTELNRLATRKAFTAAVARVYIPGTKFDYMVVLYGPQGIGKSALLERLGGEWFSDSVTNVQGKEAYEALQGAWIIEMAELAATKKAEVEIIKHFVSKKVDSYRVAYGRYKEDFPRQCVFFGTTNKIDFLRDETGGRRFWPISVDPEKVKRKWSTLTDEERDQIWAEAKYRFEQNEPLYLTFEQEKEMRERQLKHTEESPYEGMVREYLDIPIPLDWYEQNIYWRQQYIQDYLDGEREYEEDELRSRQRVCALEIWCECLGNMKNKFPRMDQREINAILKKLENWNPNIINKSGRLRFGNEYGAQKAFIRNTEEDELF